MNQNMIQAMVDGWSRQWQAERATTQLTLGGLIDALKELPSERLVVGFGKPMSYRGYYSDLAFDPTEATQTVESLLAVAQGCMGRVFTGYKGGDYVMGERTPLWLAGLGESSCPRIMGLNTDGEIVSPVLQPEED